MRKTRSSFSVTLLIVGFISGSAAAAAGQSHPVDRVSNANALDYADVEVTPKEMSPTFVRQGLVVEPQRLKSIKPGLSQAEVRSLLGDPLSRDRSRGQEWAYDIKLKIPQSQNYLVCQYKVVFDGNQLVRDTVWRRRQCEQIAEGRSGS